jgi:hypothetical protein
MALFNNVIFMALRKLITRFIGVFNFKPQPFLGFRVKFAPTHSLIEI